MDTLTKNSYITVYYYDEKFFHVDWKGYVSVEMVKKGCEMLLQHVLEKQCFNLVNDNRKVKGSWTQSIKWLEQDFMPRLVQSGLQKIAFLYSPYQSARYSLDRLLEVNDEYDGQTFENFEEATQWITGKIIEEKDARPSILLKTLDGYTQFYLDDIYYITTNSGQTIIQTAEKQHYARKTLSYFSDSLPQPYFLRIHKSQIVNTMKIKKIKYHAGGYYHLFLQDFGNIYLTVSRNYAKDLKKVFIEERKAN